MPLAVVGVACRFPGAADVDAFWRNVLDDVYAIAPMPDERFHRDRYFDPEIGAYGKSYCELGGLIEPPPFDGRAFRMPPKVVEQTDIAQLWALQVAKETLADAGFEQDALVGRDVGVIIGHARGSMLTSDMAFGTAIEGVLAHLDDVDGLNGDLGAIRRAVVEEIHGRYPKRTEDGGTGTIASALAGRISAAFGLTGRHMVVDAACASSFAALEVAARALRRGTMEMALVGGASYSQEMSVVLFAQSRALSPDGSYPFDRRANGFISSDGMGFMLLMPLCKALAAGANIHAVIRGVGGSCDGKGKALWAPRKEGQILAMARAYAASGVDPATLGLIEAHATSTPVGDRTEIESLQAVFGGSHAGRGLPIGSVKGNIGHCREAAGAAGLIKAIWALKSGTLPPTGNFREPNPEIPWDAMVAEVSTSPQPWPAPSDGSPRRAGVNAFGIGGLNYHVLVEEAPPPTRSVVSAGDLVDTGGAACPIAIVGIGARLPSASSAAEFWENLVAGEDAFTDVTEDRWSKLVYFSAGDRTPYRTYTTRGAFVRNFEADWRRYRVPPKLIERNDPLQFMLLESALDALEDAGIDPAKIDRERVAVLVGTVFGSDYALELSLSIRAVEVAEAVAAAAGRPDDVELQTAVADAVRARLPSINEDSSGSFSSSTLASRIAKTLDFMGPTFTVDAACASSLASLDTACDLLASNEVDVVLYGGGDRAMRVQRYEAYCQFHAITASEAPRPFDESADGFLPGEGAAVCALKRLDDALADGDRIHAVVRGIGSSSDGERKSLHKPSAEGLALAMRRALASGNVDPKAVTFVECHGGGTPSGDAAETEAVRAVYIDGATDHEVVIGSVKSNIGHTQGAAGVIALAKTALALGHQQLPPTLRFSKAPKAHRFDRNLRINSETEPFPRNGSAAAFAGVSSMGLGGINYHVILQGPPDVEAKLNPRASLFVIRASTSNALGARLRDISAEALFGRHREGEGGAVAAMSATSVQDLATQIATTTKAGLLDGTRAFLARQGIFVRKRPPTVAQRTCLLFSGQGSQYPGMAKALCALVPKSMAVVDRAELWLAEHGMPSLAPHLLDDVEIPAEVFTIQASILVADLVAYEALLAHGVEPDVVTGHSYGDYPALVAAGSWTLEDALEATRLRAEAIEATVAPGGMVSVIASAERVRALLAGLTAGFVAPSNLNAPEQTVVSGEPDAIDAVAAACSAQGIEARRLPIPRAFHSTMMAGARDRLQASLARIPIRAPALPFVSSVTGRRESDPEAIRAAMVDQLTLPVDFVRQIRALVSEGTNVFIECGPKGVLAGLARQIVDEDDKAADIDITTADDAERAGAWAMGRVVALAASREAPAASGAQVVLLDGEDAEAMLAEHGFDEFWARNRQTVAHLVQGLWTSQKGLVEAEAEDEDTADIPAPTAQVLTLPSADKATIEQYLIDAICEQTGYPPDIVEMDADLEADLGIDTVKQAQVLGKVRDRFSLKADDTLSLRDFPTLSHILDYVHGQLADRAATGTPSVVVPVIDLTTRRTQRPTPAPQASLPTAAPVPEAISSTLGIEAPPALEPIESITPAPAVARADEVAPDRVEILELTGTARQIGQQHGETMRESIKHMLDRYEAFLGERGLTMTSVPEATRLLPELFDEASREEIRGLAEAVGVPFEFLVAYNLDTALFPAFTTGCTQALRTAANNDGTLLHLVNEDSPLRLHVGDPQPRVVQLRRRTDGPHPNRRTVSFSLAGQLCGPNALNDAGITVTSCTLLDRAAPEGLPAGLPHPQVVKQIAEQASSLAEAMQIARAAKRSGRWSFLVSDADRDEAAYLEYDGDTVLLEGKVPGVWVSTNHAVSGPDTGCEVPEHSVLRARRAGAMIRTTEPLSADGAKAALRDRHDLARARVVDHPTMNTVRRVDNVMSLVVDAANRRLWVTDRVESPSTGPALYRQIDYGSSATPAATLAPPTVEPVSAQDADGLAQVDEVMRRYVPAVVGEAAGEAAGHFAPGTVLLVGDCDRSTAIAEALRRRGGNVHRARKCDEARVQMEALGGPAAVDTVGIVLKPAEARKSAAIDAEDWRERRASSLQGPFALLRAYAPHRNTGCIFGVTVLGGALGFDNIAQGSPDNGALLGLLKAVRREYDGLQVSALDVSPSAAGTGVAGALLTELDAGSPRLEVGLLRKLRMRVALAPRPASGWAVASTLPKTWLITGGARGVTAKIAERLARLYRPRLHLIGKHPLPATAELDRLLALDDAGVEAAKQGLLDALKAGGKFTPIEWKAQCESLDKTLEIGRNLACIAEAGSEVTYHAVDISDRRALSAVLGAVRGSSALDGLIHGAGYELAKPMDKKTDALFEATVGGKVDGLVNLLALTAKDPLTHVVGFSSVSGRFGGHGQTDYSLANEALARLLGTHRAARGDVRTTVMTWPAWSEVGLAARSSSREFLERSGQKFMSPAEGANHFVRELWAGLPEPEVIFCEKLEALDLDHLLPSDSTLIRWQALDRRAKASPLLDAMVHLGDDTLIAERRVAAEEPFLDQHRMGPMPILPAVIGLEMMAELLAIGGGEHSLGDVEIMTPLKVRPGSSALVRVAETAGALRVTASARRPDGVVLEPDRVHFTGRRLEPKPLPTFESPEWDGDGVPFPYPRQVDRTRGSRLMFHGPVFRCLQGVLPQTDGGLARLVIPPVEALVPGTEAGSWRIPAAMIDGCLQAAGLLGRMLYQLSALPIGFGRVDVSPRAVLATGELVTVRVSIRSHDDDELVSDIVAIGSDGPLLSIEGYRSKVMRGLRAG